MSARRLPNGEGVLVTGCSSGIGYATATHLARQGFTVFATVRKAADAERLQALGLHNLVPICPVDLTQPEHIALAVEQVQQSLQQRGKDGLYALVQNAGGGGVAPIEMMDLNAFQVELNARLLGSLRLVQALLPSLRQTSERMNEHSSGRIIWVMTPAIIPTPFVTGIHACDFAINCIARTLEIELQPWSIHNVMVRCGGVATPAGLRTTKDVSDLLCHALARHVALYEQTLRKWSTAMSVFDQKRIAPERVAHVIEMALMAKRPKRRYSVGHMAGLAALLEALPQPLTDSILSSRFA